MAKETPEVEATETETTTETTESTTTETTTDTPSETSTDSSSTDSTYNSSTDTSSDSSSTDSTTTTSGTDTGDKKDIDVSNYGIFSDGITSVNTLSGEVDTGVSSLNDQKSKLTSDTIFMGPICDSCSTGFDAALRILDLLKGNLATTSDYLKQSYADYNSSDANAKTKILTIGADGKMTISTHKTISTGNAVQDAIYNYLSEKGFNDAAIAGILANINHECGFDYNAVGDGGTSYGLCQWHNGRWTDLKNYCSQHGLDSTSLEGQLEFLVYELQNGYSGVYNTLMNVPNTSQGAYDAAYKWTTDFEKPADTYGQASSRGNQAVSTYWPTLSQT